MDWHWHLTQFLAQLTMALPWLLGGLGGLAVFSFSPLGRGIVKHLRDRRQDATVNEQLLGELEELRRVLGEITERLDVTERRYVENRELRPGPSQALSPPVTPH